MAPKTMKQKPITLYMKPKKQIHTEQAALEELTSMFGNTAIKKVSPKESGWGGETDGTPGNGFLGLMRTSSSGKEEEWARGRGRGRKSRRRSRSRSRR